jgi:hypothetical protein
LHWAEISALSCTDRADPAMLAARELGQRSLARFLAGMFINFDLAAMVIEWL